MPSAAERLLLLSARQHLSDRRFETITLEEIRRAAGVSNGSLFHYFPTKSHLARALYLEALASYHGALAPLLRDDVPAGEVVEGLVEAHVAWVLKHRVEARVLVELRRETQIAADRVDFGKVNADVFATLRAWVKRATGRGELGALPFELWMALVFAPVLQLTPRWLRPGSPRPTPSVRRALARAARLAVTPERKQRGH